MPNTCQQKGQPDGIKQKTAQSSFSPLFGCINKSHFYTWSPIMTGFQPFLFLIQLRRFNRFASFITWAGDEHPSYTPNASRLLLKIPKGAAGFPQRQKEKKKKKMVGGSGWIRSAELTLPGDNFREGSLF